MNEFWLTIILIYTVSIVYLQYLRKVNWHPSLKQKNDVFSNIYVVILVTICFILVFLFCSAMMQPPSLWISGGVIGLFITTHVFLFGLLDKKRVANLLAQGVCDEPSEVAHKLTKQRSARIPGLYCLFALFCIFIIVYSKHEEYSLGAALPAILFALLTGIDFLHKANGSSKHIWPAQSMKNLSFSCCLCGQAFEAPVDMIGSQITCPACGQVMIVPSPEETHLSESSGGANIPATCESKRSTRRSFESPKQTKRNQNQTSPQSSLEIRLALFLTIVTCCLLGWTIHRNNSYQKSLTTKLNAIESDVNFLSTTLADMDNELSPAIFDINSIKSALLSTELRLSSLALDVSSMETMVSSTESDVTSIYDELSAVLTAILSLDSDLNDIEYTLSSIESHVAWIENDM
jgi:DNA-directed RNA polymerase subunit RPC12/RpoP